MRGDSDEWQSRYRGERCPEDEVMSWRSYIRLREHTIGSAHQCSRSAVRTSGRCSMHIARRRGLEHGCRHPAGRPFKLSHCCSTAERWSDWLRRSKRGHADGGHDVRQRGANCLLVLLQFICYGAAGRGHRQRLLLIACNRAGGVCMHAPRLKNSHQSSADHIIMREL